MQRSLKVVTRSPEETRILGASLAPMLAARRRPQSLSGDLGAGKTVFVQGLAPRSESTIGSRARRFTIVHEYDGRYPIIHLDVYRLDSFQEVIDLGFEEFLDPGPS